MNFLGIVLQHLKIFSQISLVEQKCSTLNNLFDNTEVLPQIITKKVFPNLSKMFVSPNR